MRRRVERQLNPQLDEEADLIDVAVAHGAPAEAGVKIQKIRFQKGPEGMWGGAVYFFMRTPDGADLARDWCRHKQYIPGCVIFASVRYNRGMCLDMRNEKFAVHLAKLHAKCDGLTKQQKGRIRNCYVKAIAREAGIELAVLIAPIPLPPKESGRRPAGHCLAVYDENCISAPPYEMEVITK